MHISKDFYLFIKKALLFVTILFIPICAVNYIYVKFENEDDEYIEKFDNVPESLDVCNFGSSHGLYSFCYENYKDINCFNFALSAQPYCYDYQLMNKYKDSINENTKVILLVSYFSLFGENVVTEETKSRDKRYYALLPKNVIKDYDVKTDFYVNYFPSLDANVSKVVRVLLGKGKNDNDESWRKTFSHNELAIDAKGVAPGQILSNKIDEYGNRIINNEEIYYLEKMIELCKEKDATPILLTVPFSNELNEEVTRIDTNFFADFECEINNICDKYKIEYYDYSRDERFINNNNYFMNSDHLSKDGAIQFTNIVFKETIE